MKKNAWIALGGVGVVLVAIMAFVVGRGSRPVSAPQLPTPETGGPISGVSVAPADVPTARATAARPARKARKTATKGTVSVARPAPRPEPKRVESQVYENPALHVTVAKPRGTDWVMTDKKSNFRGVPHPQKVVEIRRSPQDGSKRFALMELYVAPVPAGSSAEAIAADIENHKGITKWAEEGKITVVDERAVTVGGRSMTRRVKSVAHKGRKTQLLSLWTVRGDKVYVLVGLTDPESFAAIEPEFEQVLNSVRID